MAKLQTFKVGEAPWEKESSQPQSFKVGSAPWEIAESQEPNEKSFKDRFIERTGQSLSEIRSMTPSQVFNAIAGADPNAPTPRNIEEALALDPRSVENAQNLAAAVLGNSAGDVVAKKAIQAVKPAVDRVGQAFKRFAEGRAAKALGATKSIVKREGAENIRQTARAALDEGVISPLGSTEKMLSRAEALRERGGKMMGEVYDKIDDAGASAFNPLDTAVKVEKELGDFYRSPINRGETRQLENTLESIVMRGDKNIPLREAQKLKEELGKVANWKNNLNVTDKEQMARQAYGIVSQAIDEAAEAGAKSVNVPGLRQELATGKKLFQSGHKATKLLEDKFAAESGNNLIGLTDFITATGATSYGLATEDWATAAAIMGAKKFGQKYGNQLAARSSDAIAKALLQSPRLAKLQKVNPRGFQALVSGMRAMGANSQTVADADIPTKGPQKWAHDGFNKILKHASEADRSKIEGIRDALMSDPKTREILMDASDLTPGSKGMDRLFRRIKNRTSSMETD